MRDYAKVEPKLWHGQSFKALRKRGYEGVIVGLYLMTSPSSNMLGLFTQPILYMAHETGLGQEGAMKGLQDCIDTGFCSYDEESEVVWVHEMARYQIASDLKATDLRCKGIQKDYDALPNNPFLPRFFDYYGDVFHMTAKRGFVNPSQGHKQAPLKPLRSQEQEQEQEQDQDQEHDLLGAKAPLSPAKLPTCKLQAVVDLYHEILPELPGVRVMDSARERAIKDRWEWVLKSTKPDGQRRAETAEQALAWFRSYFELARENDFLMGKTQRDDKHKNWKPDIEFLMKSQGLKQVLEKTATEAA
jgi:hypothetical protein